MEDSMGADSSADEVMGRIGEPKEQSQWQKVGSLQANKVCPLDTVWRTAMY